MKKVKEIKDEGEKTIESIKSALKLITDEVDKNVSTAEEQAGELDKIKSKIKEIAKSQDPEKIQEVIGQK